MPKLKLVGLTVSAAVPVPVPLSATATAAFAVELLVIANEPVAAPATVGAYFTVSDAVCFGFSVNGKVTPDIVKPEPLSEGALTVTAAVPVEVKVTGNVALDPTATLPKFRLVGLTVNSLVLEAVPVPLRLTAVLLCLAALLLRVSAPVAALAAVGANFTLSVTDCAGFNVRGKVAPETVKPVPPIVAELIISGAVPVEVTVSGSVEVDPTPTLPKLKLVELTDSCGVVAATPVLLRLTVAVALVEELLLTVSAPVTALVVMGADCTWRVTVCCGLRVSGKVAPATLNPVPLTVAELIVTAVVPVETKVIGKVEVEPTVTLPKLKLAGLAVNCDAAPEAAPLENVAICITQRPALLNGAVALLLPVAVATLSSAISPSGEVMTREVNPLPGPAVIVDTVFAPKISSLAILVVAAPLLALELFPLAPAVISSVDTPRYSRTRISGATADWLNVTVTVLLPAAIFGA